MKREKKYRKERTKCNLFDESILKATRMTLFNRRRKHDSDNFIAILMKCIEKKQCTQSELEHELKISKNCIKRTIKTLKSFAACRTSNLVKGKERILSFSISRRLIVFLLFLLNDLRCPQLLTAFEADKLKEKTKNFCKQFNKYGNTS